MDERVERALRQAALWDEVKDRLKRSAARRSRAASSSGSASPAALAVEPEVLLMDEPGSALDPIATARIEELIHELKKRVHGRDRHPQHAAGRARRGPHRVLRVEGSEDRARTRTGYSIEIGPTRRIFTSPEDPRTEAYVTGRFG